MEFAVVKTTSGVRESSDHQQALNRWHKGIQNKHPGKSLVIHHMSHAMTSLLSPRLGREYSENTTIAYSFQTITGVGQSQETETLADQMNARR